MKPYTTSDRLKQLIEERHLKQADIVAMAQPYCKMYGVHLGKSTISQYVSGKKEADGPRPCPKCERGLADGL